MSAPIFRAIAPIIGMPMRNYLDTQGKDSEMPVILITGTKDQTVPPGEWESTDFSTASDGGEYYYTGATAIIRSWGETNNCEYTDAAKSFNDGNKQTDCRTYCSRGAGWSKGRTNYAGVANLGWPKVLDCRAKMNHDYALEWSFNLILDFFEAHSL